MKFQCYYPSIMLLFLLSCTDNVESQQQTSQHSTTPEAILTRLLAGEMDAKHNAVKCAVKIKLFDFCAVIDDRVPRSVLTHFSHRILIGFQDISPLS